VNKNIFLLMILLISNLVAKDTITWGVFHRPPSIDITDIKKPSGYSGILLQMLEEKMPEYNFNYSKMTMPRILQEISEENKVCNNFLFKNAQREKIAHFSLPLRINLPLRFIMTKNTYKSLNSPQALSIKDVINNKKLRLLIEDNRSYSSIDKILKANNTKKAVVTTEQLLGMLKLNRVNIMIEYSQNIQNYDEKIIKDLVFIPIKEMYEFAYSYAVCPKNEWGKEAIKNINKALKKLIKTKEFQEHLKFLYKREKDRNFVDEIYKNHLLNEYK
jgi:polar amino acid transport system substrate-binding protein